MNKRILYGLMPLSCLVPAGVAAAPPLPQTIQISSLDVSKATQGHGQPQADRSVDNHALTLNGQVFVHGFGTHAPSLLAIDLHREAQRFQATVGVDDEVGSGKGRVEFQLLGDGKLLWKSRILHCGDPAQTADVPTSGINQLILRVTTAGAAYDYDHADWAEARVEMAGGAPQTISPQTISPQTISLQPDPKLPLLAMIPPPAAPQIHPPLFVGVRPRTPLLWTVPVTGLRPLIFTTPHLPKGVLLNKATGTLTGVLPAAGDYPITIRVRNRAGADERVVHVVAGKTLALTPPMGWNSYDAYGDSVTEAEVLANADYVQKAMQPYGWDTVVVDYRWYDPGAHDNNANGRAGADLTMDAYGRLLPALNRFPSASDGQGFSALAARVHAMGLRFGIHIMRGIPRNAVKQNLPIQGSSFHAADAANVQDTCPWCPDMYGVRGETQAGQAYYDSLFRLYASWGVDFVKMDDTSRPYHTPEIDAVRAAIDKTPRTIVYSLSPGATPLDQAAHVASHANQWRVADDFWDNWAALDQEFTLGEAWHTWAAPGHWPDGDMLPLGHLSVGNRSVRGDRRTQFTKPEQMVLLSLWALLPSPLIVGAALPDNDPWTLALLTNPEVLAVNQDAQGSSGRRVFSSGDPEVGPTEIWVKDLADGSKAVGLFNRSDFAQPVTANWAALGLPGPWKVRDLWQRRDIGIEARIARSVPAHGVVFLKISRP